MARQKGLTFDDVLLENRFTDFQPENISLRTKLTRKIDINIPFVSSPMETVTEYRMAIAMAQLGGMGIIHSYLALEEQVEQVRKVKRYESYMIRTPDLYTASPSDTVEKVIKIMQEKNISGVPIVQRNKLVGLVTRRDVESVTDSKSKVDEVMTTRLDPRNSDDRKLIIAQDPIGRDEAERVLLQSKIEKLPVADDMGNLIGLITKKDIKKRKDFPYATRDSEDRLMVGAAINIDGIERVEPLVKAGIDALCIDSAHGDTRFMQELIGTIKAKYEDRLQVIAGNVVTAEGAEHLIDAGADALRVGFGSGSGCTTREVTGVGVPQITAVKNCSMIANRNRNNTPIISDGGIRHYGDVTKALAFGASSVMLGGALAGSDESPAEMVVLQGDKYKRYRGMGSAEAMAKRRGSTRYPSMKGARVFEGAEKLVSYTGPVSETVNAYENGLRKAMYYLGVKTVVEMRKNVKKTEITEASEREGYHP